MSSNITPALIDILESGQDSVTAVTWRARAEAAEAAAQFNAETVTSQRRAYGAEVRGLHAQLREQAAANAKLDAEVKDALMKALTARRALINLKCELDRAAVVTVADGATTLGALFDSHHYREVCECGDYDCEGCYEAREDA